MAAGVEAAWADVADGSVRGLEKRPGRHPVRQWKAAESILQSLVSSAPQFIRPGTVVVS